MNNYLTLLLITLCLSVGQIAQSQVQFISSFEQAKALAAAQQKLIFVDVMASWCGPCKMMERETFSDATIANFMNTNFINLKIDGDRNPSVKNRLGVSAYPTLLILDAEGNILETQPGFMDALTLYKYSAKHTEAGVYNIFDGRREVKKQTDDSIYEFLKTESEKGGVVFLNELGNTYLEKNEVNTPIQTQLFFDLLPNVTRKNIDKFLTHTSFNQLNTAKQEKVAYALFVLHDESFRNTTDKLKKFEVENLDELVVYLQKKHALKSTLIVNKTSATASKSLDCKVISIYPQMADKLLFEDAFLNMLFYNDDEELLASTYACFLDYAEKNKSVETYDLLSLFQYKLGKNKEAMVSIQTATELSEHDGKKYLPAINLLKKEILVVGTN